MFVVLRQDSDSEQVVNIIHGTDTSIVKSWISEYLHSEMESQSMCPALPDTKYNAYTIEDDETSGVSRLVKRYKQVHRGYVYNSSERKESTVCAVRYLEFNGDNMTFESISKGLWNDLNAEINYRVIRQMDKDSLVQVIGCIQQGMSTKNNWTTSEFTALVSETLKSFRKELFSSITKRMRRYGKQVSAYKQMVVPLSDHKKQD
ncbi:MAG: hypothetical protein EBU90_14655 [Proteobacteria bacterium]|nr:hypothetical protein [Pseudomonadota bacterium]NBP15478.1 hypothetical protein [bacterium]